MPEQIHSIDLVLQPRFHFAAVVEGILESVGRDLFVINIATQKAFQQGEEWRYEIRRYPIDVNSDFQSQTLEKYISQAQ